MTINSHMMYQVHFPIAPFLRHRRDIIVLWVCVYSPHDDHKHHNVPFRQLLSVFVVAFAHQLPHLTLHIKIGWRKVKICLGWLSKKWLWLSIFSQSATLQRLSTGTAKLRCALAEEECNIYDLLIDCCSLFSIGQSEWLFEVVWFQQQQSPCICSPRFSFRGEITKK